VARNAHRVPSQPSSTWQGQAPAPGHDEGRMAPAIGKSVAILSVFGSLTLQKH
jgi:hypothetical protein